MSSAAIGSDIGKNQFLQLFAAQLQHQDPTSPMDQQQFLAQLAQFSTVEGITNLNSGFESLGKKLDSLISVSSGSGDLSTLQSLTAGAGLLGKHVELKDNAATLVGTVTEIKPDHGHILVKVGDAFHPVSSIIGVTND